MVCPGFYSYGAVVDAGDVSGLARELGDLAPADRARSAAARAAVTELSIERTARDLTALYRRLLGLDESVAP